MSLSKITNCIWFDDQGEEAAAFYTAIFPNSKIGYTSTYLKTGSEFHGKKPGSVMSVNFELDGHPFMALNGGPIFKPTPGISFQVDCKDQAEIDYYWSRLGEGGDSSKQQCGWLEDKFGVSWQVIPMHTLEKHRDAPTAQREKMTQAIFDTKKIEIAKLEAPFESK